MGSGDFSRNKIETFALHVPVQQQVDKNVHRTVKSLQFKSDTLAELTYYFILMSSSPEYI